MKKQSKAVLSLALIAAFGLIVLTTAQAGYGKKTTEQKQEAAAAPAAEAASAADKEAMMADMMAKMKEYATPNENHKILENLVGSWDYTLKWWMSPEGQPEESTGTSEGKWVLDGRFVEQTAQGTSMGQPFTGSGTTGYDNATKEYVSTWMDNMGTGIMLAKGNYDPASKTLTQTADFTCPIKGPMTFRWVTKITDENNHVFETYTTDEKGNEFKCMEINYKKKQ